MKLLDLILSETKTTSIKQLKENAENGNVHAQYNLALLLYDGQWMPKNRYESKLWCKKAADQGHTAAQRFLNRF